ncbi:MAG: L-glutamate gamma-semialdehyde dehydrogenase [Pseudomonadota bacterium]|nr:L-glutamate gamma-semialdehyde dehydrogenase [Pseudomonadota bacterium]
MSKFTDSGNYLKDIASLYQAGEEDCLAGLFPAAQLTAPQRMQAKARAAHWIEAIRRTHKPQASVNDLLSRFGLTSNEGLALMCLAEALLRIPDRATADALIRDKLSETHWNDALGTQAPWAMNIAGWALSITGKVIGLEKPDQRSPGAALGNLISRLGQPAIREAIRAAMQWLADQFVTGETIGNALERSRTKMETGARFSFDMLGEGARTAEDAARYAEAYEQAIDAIGAFQARHKFERPSGISIKLSALHPRYEMTQRSRVMNELVPRLASLCERAASHDIPVTIDAEEADRLQLSLEVADELLNRAKLGTWQGLGFAVQAYQKRAPAVIDYLIALGRAHARKIHIRLVKGAYWDSEIKRAQERGWSDFPVFTRKPGTDVSYLACAKRLLEAGDGVLPIFGTHNAMTAAQILEMAKDPRQIEFQKLHGMNDDLYRFMQQDGLSYGVYAPVGDHDVLLGYLVRRILENGANSSFVHRLLDRTVSVAELTEDPVEQLASKVTLRHPTLRRPPDLYRPGRANSAGLDLSDPFIANPLLDKLGKTPFPAPPTETPEGSIAGSFEIAQNAAREWSRSAPDGRATCLEKLGGLLERDHTELFALLVREGGKTLPDALAEIREAVDFCRYYAMRARIDFEALPLPGPVGERNELRFTGRGVFLCISPWNFPLAIFLGQITAALAAGNAVMAKPASQTRRIAVHVARLIAEAGFPNGVFHLVIGGGRIGALMVEQLSLAGVAVTGSTATAHSINRALAAKSGPIVPLIAETGGQNAMIVDSSALPEQVVDDVLTSAFRSAGQRCSALRVLFLPEPTADRILKMLAGAMRELRVGDPLQLETDVGPVIDDDAKKSLLQHVERLQSEAKEIFTTPLSGECAVGSFVAPQAWEIPSIAWLEGEVFGPILHVIRYKPQHLDDVIESINRTGFGLTGGLHSRIDRVVRHVERKLAVGNFYVNRSMIGAIVGVQPFGGEGLSGTGPKAGGPHYLFRFAHERVTSDNVTAAGGNASLMTDDAETGL